jgi:hypothetical protein
MTFEEILDQAVAMLQRLGRVTYRTLRAQFHLDDDLLETLKDQLLFSHPVVEEDARGLVWTGDPAAPEPDAQRGAGAESRFHALLPDVMARLQRERRITYRTLKHALGIDDVLLEQIRTELRFKRLWPPSTPIPRPKACPGMSGRNSTPICNAAFWLMALCGWAVTPAPIRCCSPSVASGAGFAPRVRGGAWRSWRRISLSR